MLLLLLLVCISPSLHLAAKQQLPARQTPLSVGSQLECCNWLDKPASRREICYGKEKGAAGEIIAIDAVCGALGV